MDNKEQSRLWDREDELITAMNNAEMKLEQIKRELKTVQHELSKFNEQEK